MNKEMEVINERPHDCKRKWKRIFIKCINGETREVARFVAWGDAALYVQRLKDSPAKTIETLYIR